MTNRQLAAYLLDRADQYDTDSPCWIALSDAAANVANGEVDLAISHGELEDSALLARVDSMRGKTKRLVDKRLGADDD